MAGEPAAMRDLLDGLIESGLNIARFGNSRPASGLEHHASHFWDLLASRGMHEQASHGLQVGYATGFGMRIQRYAYGGGVPELSAPRPAADPLGQEAQEWLGEPTEELIAAVRAKQAADRGAAATWPADRRAWLEVCEAIGAAMEPFADVERALEQAEIPTDARLPGDHARDARGNLPPRHTAARPLHDDRLPRGAGASRSGDRAATRCDSSRSTSGRGRGPGSAGRTTAATPSSCSSRSGGKLGDGCVRADLVGVAGARDHGADTRLVDHPAQRELRQRDAGIEQPLELFDSLEPDFVRDA